MPAESSLRTSRPMYALGLFLLIALALVALWIVPYRMWTGPGGSYYTFAYIGDEVMYADKIQPLVPGTSSVNWYNGFGDARMASPYFLEDFLRAVLTLTGIPVITFYWLCRILFPLAMFLLFYTIAVECLPFQRRSWGRLLRVTTATLAMIGIYCVYDLVTAFPPWQGFIVRVPTNFEYPVSALLAWSAVRFFKSPDVRRGVVLAIVSALLLYVRPYAAIPWAYALTVAMILALVSRRVTLRHSFVILGCLLLAALPWFYVGYSNRSLPAYIDLKNRIFTETWQYEVHSKQFLFLGLAALFAVLSRFVESRLRPLAIGAAVSMALLPYTVGLLSERREMLSYDRFGVCYLVLLPTIGFLVLARAAEHWRGWRGQGSALKAAAALCALSLLATGLVARTNATLDFNSWGPYRFLVEDARYLKAYEWIAKNTSPDALVLTAEGYDYAQLPSDPAQQTQVETSIWNRQEDLFMVQARRRRLYCEHLRGEPLTNDELYGLAMLHRGTLGFPADAGLYRRELAKYKPNYILWRKTPALTLAEVAPPVPRGYGAMLKGLSKTVYEDEVAEIWELQWKAGPQ